MHSKPPKASWWANPAPPEPVLRLSGHLCKMGRLGASPGGPSCIFRTPAT